MFAAHALGVLVVTAGITITSGWPGRSMIRQVAIFGAVVNLANTTAGLAMITSLWERSNVGVLLLGLALLLFLLYRSFPRLGARHTSLETLPDFPRQLGWALEIISLNQAVV